jgi:hypothetical protein
VPYAQAMRLHESAAFAAFLQKRSRLIESLNDLGNRLDNWIQTSENVDLTMTDVAHLEGLLSGRRDLVNELAALDDSFMSTLLTLLTPEPTN